MKKLFAFTLFAVVWLPSLYAQIKVYDTIRGLNEPMAFVMPNTDTFLVTQRPGQVIKRTANMIIPMYTVPDIFYSNMPNAFSANGLIGICLHPNYKTNKLFYIFYTCMAPNPYLANPVNPYPYQYPNQNPQGAPANPDELPQLTVDLMRDDGMNATFINNIWRWSVPVHMRPANMLYEERYGGNIRIGADSMLYITVGDLHFTGGYVPLQPSNAQNYFNPAGKILRLHLNGQPVRPPLPFQNHVANPFFIANASDWSLNFAVPQWAGNSQFNAECLYSAGFRNAFDFALNPLNNRFIAEENGDVGGDEINDIRAGVNYQYQGPANALVYPYNNSGPMPGSDIGIGPTGVLMYTGDCIPEWKNTLLTASIENFPAYSIKRHTFVDPPTCSQIYANEIQLTFANTTITTLMQGTNDDYVYALANNVNFLPNTGCIYRIGKETPASNRVTTVMKNCPYPLKVCGHYQYPKYNCDDSARLVAAG